MLYQAFRRVAADHGDRVAVRSAEGEEISYAQLVHLVERISAELSTLGVAPGDVVATRLANSPGYVGLILALARSGAVHVPISRSAAPDRIDWSIERTGPRLLVDEPDHGPYDRLPTVGLDELVTGRARLDGAAEPAVHTGLFRMLETTGSTGMPKLVSWRQDDLLADRSAWLSYLGITPDDVFLTMHPLDVAHGVDVHMFPALLAGARLVLSDPEAAPGLLVDDLDRSGATVFSALPRHYDQLAGCGPRTLSRLRLPLCGGAYLSQDVVRQSRHRLGIHIRRIYGSTEFGIVLGNLDDVPQEDRGMRPLPEVQVQLGPLTGQPSQPPAGEGDAGRSVGEILARSPHTSRGYHADPTATAQAFRDGWYHTGDVAERTPTGEYRVLGRVADAMPADGGVRFAAPVEAALQACGLVAEAAVLPSLPGVEPVAAVVGARDASADTVRAAAEKVLREHGLAIPLRVLDQLPYTPSARSTSRSYGDVSGSRQPEPASSLVSTVRGCGGGFRAWSGRRGCQVNQCISLGRRDVQYVTADDRATSYHLSGKLAARYKEFVCRGAAWAISHPTLMFPSRRRHLTAPLPVPLAADR
ncbi:acyl-CoA synthetase [Micromonospora endophytica]|nr:acyl-CoA synthetase [Micromonospora endophytica]